MTRSEFGSVAFELKTVAEFAPADFSERFVALRMSSGSNVSGISSRRYRSSVLSL
jgi:hypothetical protein